jgi:hypothetical protein
MKCAVHPEVDASGYCRNCGKPMCAVCVRPVRDVLYCEECLAQVMGLPAPQTASPAGSASAECLPAAAAPVPMAGSASKGSPVVAFFLGLMPGLGAIYNGQYNKALIHIVIFAAMVVGLSSDMDSGPTVALSLMLAGFIVYMGIDAARTVKARQAGEPAPDPLENWSKDRPIGPMILIGLGVLFLLSNFGVFEYLRFRQFFWPMVLIGVGFLMLRNRMGGQR